MSCNIFLFVLISCVFSVTTVPLVRSRIEPEKLVDIQNYLKKINKPAVKTIKSLDGDLIDCVLFHQQPAFDHPLLQGHTPITDPPELPTSSFDNNINNTFDEEVYQLWRMSGESCPENTIPIRRTTEEDVLRVRSLQRFGRRRANLTDHRNDFVSDEASLHEVHINVWHPKVENNGEFSLTQIWVIGGATTKPDDINSIEAGTMTLYGDEYPRLFAYYTNDGYKGRLCYNLDCGGFVQLKSASHVALGGALLPFSTYNGPQKSFKITVWKSRVNGHWWLAVNGKSVGYWPSTLFPLLRESADSVEFGGEIVNYNIFGRHTSTHMGSGHFPDEDFGKAAYVRNVELVNSNNKLIPAENFKSVSTNPECYGVKTGKGKIWGTYMYYGGPWGRHTEVYLNNICCTNLTSVFFSI